MSGDHPVTILPNPQIDARPAPDGPGVSPTWSSSDKDFVTSSLGPARLWATIGHGVLNEVYWPSTGTPMLRDLTFYLVGAQGEGGPRGWADLKRVRRYSLQVPAPFVPLPTAVHTGEVGGVPYRLELEFLPDPMRDALLVSYRLEGPYRLCVVAAPHIGGTGLGNRAWVDGEDLLADNPGKGGTDAGGALCLCAEGTLRRPSAGYVGANDGWQDLRDHGRLTHTYTKAGPGTVALSAELHRREGTLALAFAETPTGARTLARSSLAAGRAALRERFVADWCEWGSNLGVSGPTPELTRLAQLSAAVLRMHEDRTFPGALVASLSVPWGNSTDSLGGYHLVWPRDAVLSAFAQVAVGELEDARRVLLRLIAVQERDGHWAQNAFPDGRTYWNAVQLDETALPVLLAAKLRELGQEEPAEAAAAVRRATAFIARTGPASEQDRWEENPGVNPFTLSLCIAALVAGAQWLRGRERDYALSLAADWNERLEHWCFVQHTPLAEECGVNGYYIRMAPPEKNGGFGDTVLLRNRWGQTIAASALVSLDFTYLARLGLRDVTDPRIQSTLRVVDRVLRRATPAGEWLYYRYNDDGYGEQADGSPYNGNGIGRLWPLLTGERGQLAVLEGKDAAPYLQTMLNCASPGGMLPEQVWDTKAIPAKGLFPGKATGSAMPLSWSHAEFLKLLVASQTGRAPERLRVVDEFVAAKKQAGEWHWRDDTPITQLNPQYTLRIESARPFRLRFGWDGQQEAQEVEARSGAFGIWYVSFGLEDLQGHTQLSFVRQFKDGERAGRWEETAHTVALHTAEVQAVAKG